MGEKGPRCLRKATNADGVPASAARWNALPSQRSSVPNLASQMRTATLQHGLEHWLHSSPGELEITRSTSEVAALPPLQPLSSSLPFGTEFRGCHPRASSPSLAAERSLRAHARRLFAPLQNKVTLVGTPVDPGSPRPCACSFQTPAGSAVGEGI